MTKGALMVACCLAGACSKSTPGQGPDKIEKTPAAAAAAATGAPAAKSAVPSATRETPGPKPVAVPSDADLKGRLADLNALCGDTWCEGEYDYKFTKLACRGRSCDLSFTAKHDDGKTHQSTVKVTGFTSVVPDDDGLFDEAVGEALERWERAPKK